MTTSEIKDTLNQKQADADAFMDATLDTIRLYLAKAEFHSGDYAARVGAVHRLAIALDRMSKKMIEQIAEMNTLQSVIRSMDNH